MTEPVGRIDGAEHRFPVRVYWEDTDAGGVVYYANYLRFAERGRTDLLRRFGIEQARLAEDEDVVFVVRRCEIDFLAPARLDDLLDVRTRIKGLGGAVIEAEQRICRDGIDLVRLSVRLACLRRGRGRPARLPANVRDAFGRLCNA